MNMSIKKSLVRIDQLETNSSSIFGKNVTNGPIIFFYLWMCIPKWKWQKCSTCITWVQLEDGFIKHKFSKITVMLYIERELVIIESQNYQDWKEP